MLLSVIVYYITSTFPLHIKGSIGIISLTLSVVFFLEAGFRNRHISRGQPLQQFDMSEKFRQKREISLSRLGRTAAAAGYPFF